MCFMRAALVLAIGTTVAGTQEVAIPPVPPGHVLVGDMILRTDQAGLAGWDGTVAPPSAAAPGTIGISRWPNGVMPVEFDATISAQQRSNFFRECDKWTAVSGFRCTNRTGESIFSRVVRLTGLACYASVGAPLPGSSHHIRLTDGCLTGDDSSMLHEIGHALGLLHEHQRGDRDDFVWTDPAVTSLSEYQRAPPPSQLPMGPYDFMSIMHYPDRGRRFVPKPGFEAYFGRMGHGGNDGPPYVPTDLDGLAARALYDSTYDGPPRPTFESLAAGGCTNCYVLELALAPASVGLASVATLNEAAIPQAGISFAPVGNRFQIRYAISSTWLATSEAATQPLSLRLSVNAGGSTSLMDLLVRMAPVSPANLPPPGAPLLTFKQYNAAPGLLEFDWDETYGSSPTAYSLLAGTRPGGSDLGSLPLDAGLVLYRGRKKWGYRLPVQLPGGRFYVRLVASNAFGQATSNEMIVGRTPPSPTLLLDTAANPVSLRWAVDTRLRPVPQGYVLSAGTTPGGSDLGVFPMGLSTRIAANAPLGLRLYVRVDALADGFSVVSNEVSFTPRPPGPQPAPVLNPAQVIETLVYLSWTGADGYAQVRARAMPSGPVIASLWANGASLSVAGVPPGTYYVSVVGFEGGVESAESNLVEVTVL